MTKTFKSAINIPSGSISGSVIATQAWVAEQGYGSGGGSSSSITASAGTVGGWNISSSNLYNQGSASSYVGMQSASTASYAFFAGGQNSSGSAAPFYVTPAGTLTANSASISGVVNFTSGSVGPFTISLLSLTSASGAITASNGTFTGNLTASSGKVYLPAAASAGGYQIFAGNNDGNFIALGASVLQNWYNGNSNTYSIGIGYQALSQITAGNGGDNLAIGTKALGSASTYNTANSTAIGNYTLYNQTSGANVESSYSTAVGWRAMGLASGTLTNNTAIGANAMQSASTSSNNTAIGYNSLPNLSTGLRNTALGSNSGKVTTTGSYNLSLGYNVSLPSGSTSGVVLIGNDSGGGVATATLDNQIVLGTANHTTIIPGAASIGGNRVTTNDIIRGMNHTPAGMIDIVSRLTVNGPIFLTASTAVYLFFTASETINASSISIYSVNTVTAALRYGLYTVTNGDLLSASLTLVARSASTSVTTNSDGLTTKTFDTTGGYPASYTLSAGSRYAIGIISYGAPSILGNSLVTQGLLSLAPYVSRIVSSQSDLTLAASASSMTRSGQFYWARLQ